MHCRMFNNIPGLHLLDVSNTFPKVMTIKMSPDIANVPRGEKGVCPIYPQVLLCPYSKQDNEEEFHPHKPLNFDIVEGDRLKSN